jgi:hypothetical protein
VGCLSGCDQNTVEPERLPDGAVEIAPDQFYPQWWAQVEQCSGKTADFSAVRWYIVPSAFSFRVTDGSAATGAYYQSFNAIVLAEKARDEPFVVRHEELHAILRQPGHPPEYFTEKCGSLVTVP